jgi:monofunctional biosynthetic peptidoglycan transglycosylase
MSKYRLVIPIMGFALVCTDVAEAHQPILSDGSAVDAETAIELDDIQVSRVLYHELSEDSPQLWLTFEIEETQELLVQLGVPAIDRLAEFRPVLALVGANLPPVDLPIEIPPGLGGLVVGEELDSEPEFFHEPFTGTDSWILVESTLRLAPGRYFLVAHSPESANGKLWVAAGQEEVFDLDDLADFTEIVNSVRAFHEVPPVSGLPCFFFPLAVVLGPFALLRLTRKKCQTMRRTKDIARQAALILSMLWVGWTSQTTLGSERTVVTPKMLFNFENVNPKDQDGDPWFCVNDGVMGGVSDGRWKPTDENTLVFHGRLSLENNGGFASIRSRPNTVDLADFDGLLIRIRGDGRRYAMTLRTDLRIRAGSYRARFETAADEWVEIFLPFEEFEATSFGRVLNNAPALNRKKIESFGFLLADKNEGPFRLEVDWIKAISRSDVTNVLQLER